MPTSRAPEDLRLVNDFLAAVEDLSGLEVQDRVPGVTQNDVSRWRRNDWVRLTAAKRRSLHRFLQVYEGEREHEKLRNEAVLLAAGILERQARELRRKVSEGEGVVPDLPIERVQGRKSSGVESDS